MKPPIHLALISVGLQLFAIGPSDAAGFLTLPFATSRSVHQGWIYNDGTSHRGIDYMLPEQTPILAAADGVAMVTQEEDDLSIGYGRFVLMRHDNGWFTLYAHLNSAAAGIPAKFKRDTDYNSWKRVKRGDVIAYSGNTGRSTGPHLHFVAFQCGYACGYTDPYDIYGKASEYPPNQGKACGENSLWTACPPVTPDNPCNPDYSSLYVQMGGNGCGTSANPLGSVFDAFTDKLGNPATIHISGGTYPQTGTLDPKGKSVHLEPEQGQTVTLGQ